MHAIPCIASSTPEHTLRTGAQARVANARRTSSGQQAHTRIARSPAPKRQRSMHAQHASNGFALCSAFSYQNKPIESAARYFRCNTHSLIDHCINIYMTKTPDNLTTVSTSAT